MPTLAHLTLPARILVSAILITLAMGMAGAMGQIIIHDIIPTFFSEQAAGAGHHAANHSDAHGKSHEQHMAGEKDFFADMGADDTAVPGLPMGRGDLFSDTPLVREAPEKKAFYKTEQFIWTLRWTHIHLFGINMIFILLGGVTLLLDMGGRARTWLIALPFFGVFTDIATMWLKGYVSPVFFWLHIPGGGIFGTVFIFVFFRALWEMWGRTCSEKTDGPQQKDKS
ncbi:hypothetical protein DENIS_1286 [Desulfonema ishimotonii]|uniref:Uncharacterized protein n=2 Tax=Desulfonema ishimotonii TaxID=45657 RepID=A0A401FTQ4_9BACT|nr:hypothetical protein DENIS_1286 [Desulfonema ishimotonii]